MIISFHDWDGLNNIIEEIFVTIEIFEQNECVVGFVSD